MKVSRKKVGFYIGLIIIAVESGISVTQICRVDPAAHKTRAMDSINLF